MRNRLSRVCFLIAVLAAGALPVLAQHEYTESEIEAGKQQYTINCARCHGPDGDNVANADIGRGKFRRASTDAALVTLIRNGIPGTTMAAFANMTEPNAQTIVAYLRSMASTAAAVAALPAGDAGRGKTIFDGKGACGSCHRVGDRGSRVGPDLSQIGGQRRTVELHRSIVEPDAEVIPANRFFRIVTKEGATFNGRLLNQDTFTVQILDAKDEKLKSFAKSNLREYAFVNNSPMPSFKDKLSTQELSDLISYLTSLKGQAN
jgi:putative heme-binding domain-containing protein